MAQYAISDVSNFDGYWFLPSEPSNKIPGSLVWDKRASLSLHDAFHKLSGHINSTESQEHEAIYGQTVDNQLVSVLKALRTKWTFSFGAAGTSQPEKFTSSLFIIGDHVDPETLYTEISAEIPGLQIWLGQSGLKLAHVFNSDNKLESINLEATNLPEEVVQLGPTEGTLNFIVRSQFSGEPLTNLSIKTTASLKICSPEPKDIDWFFQQLGKATTLLSFLSGSPMGTDKLTAKLESGNVVSVLVALRESALCSFKSAHEFFLPRQTLGVQLEDVFQKWFEAYDAVATTSQLALGVLLSDSLWLHIEFLTLMQALEGFHRAVDPGSYCSPEEYEPTRVALVNAIPTTVAADHRQALKSKVKWGYEFSLRKRLDQLTQKIGEDLAKKILGGIKVPTSWVDTRNYYTHWDESEKSKVLDGIEMHRASVRLRLLVRALYLDLAAIPKPTIATALDGTNHESQYLIQLNATKPTSADSPSTSGMLTHTQLKDPQEPDPLEASAQEPDAPPNA